MLFRSTHEIARATRSVMVAEREDALLIAENTQDASSDLLGDGWHGTMNYSAFTRPVWGWLRRDDHIMGMGPEVPAINGRQFVATLTDFMAKTPWRSWTASWNYLGCHDSARIRSVVGSAQRQWAGLGLLIGLPGTPMIFAGDEFGLEGDCDDLARSTIPWTDESRWDKENLRVYTTLLNLRKSTDALSNGGLRWVHVGDDLLIWLRESQSERLLIAVARRESDAVTLDAAGWGLATSELLFSSDAADVQPDAHATSISFTQPGTKMWRLS